MSYPFLCNKLHTTSTFPSQGIRIPWCHHSRVFSPMKMRLNSFFTLGVLNSQKSLFLLPLLTKNLLHCIAVLCFYDLRKKIPTPKKLIKPCHQIYPNILESYLLVSDFICTIMWSWVSYQFSLDRHGLTYKMKTYYQPNSSTAVTMNNWASLARFLACVLSEVDIQINIYRVNILTEWIL